MIANAQFRENLAATLEALCVHDVDMSPGLATSYMQDVNFKWAEGTLMVYNETESSIHFDYQDLTMKMKSKKVSTHFGKSISHNTVSAKMNILNNFLTGQASLIGANTDKKCAVKKSWKYEDGDCLYKRPATGDLDEIVFINVADNGTVFAMDQVAEVNIKLNNIIGVTTYVK
jgi:hypothetical protein